MSKDSLFLKVITSRKILIEEDVQEVSLPSLEGYLGILPGHRPLFVLLGKGVLSFKCANKEESFAVHGGYASILEEEVLVFTELGKDEENTRAES